jgi:site-specific recombinase XerD
MTGQSNLAPLLQAFFTQRLMQQRQASAHTIASYRDTWRLLLQFAQRRLHKAPSALALEDIDAPLVTAFLDDLETVRRVTARTRNLRLTAVHSFFRYAAFEAPATSAQIQRVLAIPAKRFTRALVPFLSRPEVDALLAAPDQRTWSGRRDHALILLAVQTGLRLSELTSLRPDDLHVGTGAHVRVIGKGRKERCTPLSKNTRAVLAAWVREPPLAADQPLFPNARGGTLSAHGVQYLLAKHVAAASDACPSLKRKRVSPHVLRHYHGDGPAAGGHGADRDRTVAGPRVDRDNPGLPGRRPGVEAEDPRQDDSSHRQAWSLPPRRQAAGVLEGVVGVRPMSTTAHAASLEAGCVAGHSPAREIVQPMS